MTSKVGEMDPRIIAERHAEVLRSAHEYAGLLERSTLFMFGSWSLGLGDEHSDVDLMAVGPAEAIETLPPGRGRLHVLSDYPLPSFCKIKSIAALQEELLGDPIVTAWMYAAPLFLGRDPLAIREIFRTHSAAFAAQSPRYAQTHYIEVRRWADWLVNLSRRPADPGIGVLKATYVRGVLRTVCLMHGFPYPYDKWLWRVTLRSNTQFSNAFWNDLEAILLSQVPSQIAVLVEAVFVELRTAGIRLLGSESWLLDPGAYIVDD